MGTVYSVYTVCSTTKGTVVQVCKSLGSVRHASTHSSLTLSLSLSPHPSPMLSTYCKTCQACCEEEHHPVGRGREILSCFPRILLKFYSQVCCHHGRWMCATCGSTNADTRKSKSPVCQFQPKLGNGLALFKTGPSVHKQVENESP